jgi:hypothetical protein
VSKGLGQTELFILRHLLEHPDARPGQRTIASLSRAAWPGPANSRAQRESLRQAAKSLARKGYVRLNYAKSSGTGYGQIHLLIALPEQLSGDSWGWRWDER